MLVVAVLTQVVLALFAVVHWSICSESVLLTLGVVIGAVVTVPNPSGLRVHLGGVGKVERMMLVKCMGGRGAVKTMMADCELAVDFPASVIRSSQLSTTQLTGYVCVAGYAPVIRVYNDQPV